MGENVQCPVCTLYLHAGMNLSDHLETHPKEQVIRALVQMTISGVGGGTSALASVLKGVSSSGADVKKPLTEPEEKSLANDKISELNTISTVSSCNASISNSVSNCSLSNQSTTSSQTSNNMLNFANAHIAENVGTEPVAPVEPVLKSEETTNKTQTAKDNANEMFVNTQRTYANSTSEITDTTFTIFGNQRYHQQRQQRNVGNPQHQQMPPPPAPQGQHPEISRTILPQHLPQPMSSQSMPQGFHSMQAQQLPHDPPHHTTLGNVSNSHARQPNVFAGQHQPPPHHQQDIKVIYSSGLPPPPPLQLFSYQPQSQHQHHHQKPPPAYGAAISQIRSQNKHQVTGQFAAQHHHASMATHHDAVLHQQQQLHQQQPTHHLHHLRVQGTVAPPPPIATKHLFSKTSDVPHSTSSTVVSQSTRLSSSQPQQHHQSKYFVPQQQIADVENQSLYKNSLTTHDIQNKAVKGSTADTVTNAAQSQVEISPAVASASMAAVAASTLSRHTNSPFAALLAAAAGAPSPSNSSVLRYAESPVAHYLERDNGDFIVQETPKHIVECVEKDNGEFSVIERIYQSPPSVLHIHDDADDDDEDDDTECSEEGSKADNSVANNSDSIEKASREERKDGHVKSQLKKRASSSPATKEDNNQCRNSSKKSIEAKSASKKSNNSESTSSDSEIVDFVSISSDSDEEEFISHERKDNKNTTDKFKKNEPATLPSASTSSGSRVQHSTPTGAEAQVSPSTSQSNSSNNPVMHQSSTRKKSSKNTITVLSDVQLNLNEYLDLVGNIIASSKVAAQRRTFTSIAPIPLVKIEKEEPMDDYATNAENNVEQPLPPAPLKANKQETEDLTDNPSSSSPSNKPNLSITDQTLQERNEKKPQGLENTQENNNNVSTPSFIKNSSQVTSVIRMATSQHPQQPITQQPLHLLNKSNNVIPECISATNEANKISAEAEDLSHNLSHNRNTPTSLNNPAQSKTIGHTVLGRKGPKKLVIKPMSSKKHLSSSAQEVIDDLQPSTSAKALKEYSKTVRVDDSFNENEVQVKNEPLTSITFENNQYHQQNGYSILEQHLNSKEPIMVCKEEKPCIQESSLSTAVQEMKVENNVNDDARVLYDFATSKKANTNNKSSIFPSPSSLFAKIEREQSVNSTRKTGEDKSIHLEIETSSYSSQSAMDAINPPEEQTKKSSTNTPTSSEHNGNSQMFPDFPFNYIYSNNVTEQVDIKNPRQLVTFYQNTTATSSKSTNAPMALEDSSSSKNYTDYNQQPPPGTSSQTQWFNNYQSANEANAPSISSNHSNSNINNHLSSDCSTAVDGSEVGKYLDLDECKREQCVDVGGSVGGTRDTVPPPPSSSTSCSFTENSMAGICSTAGTLNIRTDEKMPAKGEISEQESNCDIDNSWSQPIYGDISARFFKTTFPGIFQQDNGWNNEEYFTVQDLSASGTSQTTNANSNKPKSFDFRLQSEDNSAAVAGNSASSVLTIFSQNSNDNCNMDALPSTSAKVRKRRKRNSQDGKTSAQSLKRVQPTSTITSQQMMQSQSEVHAMDYNFQQDQLPSTSTAFLAGPSNADMTETSPSPSIVSQQSQQQRIRTKVYECGHCNAKYSKLKDRNAHMVDVHNYVRQNRRLVCLTNGIAVPMTDAVAMPTTSGGNNGLLTPAEPNTDGSMSDFKQGIVKIENENIHRDISGYEHISADLRAKSEEVDDDKQNLSLVAISSSTSASQIALDAKPPNFQPLSLSTTTSKLTTLYRMLVTFNMTTLKQSQRMSEFDENLIKSSIFFCYICRQNFNSVKLYDAHLTEHPAECFTCGKKFQRWKNFSLHLKRHLGWKEFGCTVCDKKFVVRSALVEHMRMHSGLSPLKCKVCGKHFKRYSNLTQHRKRHMKQVIRRKEYVCYCGEVLPSKARFLWHKETHDSKPKCCPHCCDRFVHVNSLRRHIRLAHSEKFDYTEPMECPICKQIFAKASMKAHMATHSTDTQYDCAICNKSFSTKWNLKIHSWVHANRTAKPFKCEHCPKAFVREVDFKNHMNSHKQIKPYTCEVCGCKFIRKYNYMRHRREHHGNKKYTCDLCKKSFHRHYYLIEHRRIHTGERPFQCTICGKSSTTKTNHNKHLKIHHSRDPFTVEV